MRHSLRETFVVPIVLLTTIVFTGCSSTPVNEPVFFVPKLSEKEQTAQRFTDEMGKDAVDFLELLAKNGVEKHPDNYQLFLEEMTRLMFVHYEDSHGLVQKMVKKQIDEDPKRHYPFLRELLDKEMQADLGFALEMEMYASEIVKEDMERLRKESNVKKLQAQEKEIAMLKQYLASAKRQASVQQGGNPSVLSAQTSKITKLEADIKEAERQRDKAKADVVTHVRMQFTNTSREQDTLLREKDAEIARLKRFLVTTNESRERTVEALETLRKWVAENHTSRTVAPRPPSNQNWGRGNPFANRPTSDSNNPTYRYTNPLRRR